MYNPRFAWRDDQAFPDDDEDCPDFAGIAERLSEMQKLEARGWWGETSFDQEQEEVMRTVAHVVGRVAGDMATNLDPEGSMGAQLMEEVHHFLHWYQNFAADDEPDFRRRVEHVRHQVGELACEMEQQLKKYRGLSDG